MGFNIASALAAFAAAALWWRASRVMVAPDRKPQPDGWYPASITVDVNGKEIDPFATAIRGSQLNAYAAVAAAVAALSQGLALVFAACGL
jgi:hypothetical protein